jgi:hypothetical protein
VTLALIYEDTNKCDNVLYTGNECYMEKVEFALIELPDMFHIAHLCSYHALPVLIDEGEFDANDV